MDRFKRELGWTQADSVRLGLAALAALLGDATANSSRELMTDGRRALRLSLGDGRSVRLREGEPGGAYYMAVQASRAQWTAAPAKDRE